jgi:hypothetical protein
VQSNLTKVNYRREFDKDKVILQNMLRRDSWYDELESWCQERKNENFSKKEIYCILSELFVYVQDMPGAEQVWSNRIQDFLDRFTSWGKEYRIWPNEPDIENL